MTMSTVMKMLQVQEDRAKMMMMVVTGEIKEMIEEVEVGVIIEIEKVVVVMGEEIETTEAEVVVITEEEAGIETEIKTMKIIQNYS